MNLICEILIRQRYNLFLGDEFFFWPSYFDETKTFSKRRFQKLRWRVSFAFFEHPPILNRNHLQLGKKTRDLGEWGTGNSSCHPYSEGHSWSKNKKILITTFYAVHITWDLDLVYLVFTLKTRTMYVHLGVHALKSFGNIIAKAHFMTLPTSFKGPWGKSRPLGDQKSCISFYIFYRLLRTK